MKRPRWRDVDPRLGAGLILLVVLWGAAAVPAVAGAADRVRSRATADRLGGAVDTVVVALQEERRLAVAAPSGGDAAARSRTDRAVADLSALTGGRNGWTYTSEAVDSVEELTSTLRTLGAVRSRTDRGELLDGYRAIITAGLDLPWLPARPLARAREALSEQDALLRTALSTRAGVTDAELLRVGDLAGRRSAWLAEARTELAAAGEPLAAVEQRLLLDKGPQVAPADWAAAADPVNAALRTAQTRAVHDTVTSATPGVAGATVFAGLVAGVGLIAVIGILVMARRAARRPAAAAQTAGDDPRDDTVPGMQALLLDMHRRSQRLLHRLLRLLDTLERAQTDDETLDQLFRADHLATRVRRNVEKAITLAGGTPGRQWQRPMPLGEVVRGAAAEVDDYQRVSTAQIQPAALAGDAVLEVTHLLAELIDNAITYSPAETRVRVSGSRDDEGGYTVTVTDAGQGMSDLDLENARQVMSDPRPPGGGLWSGLYAVGRFAARHAITVRLFRGPSGGFVAEVSLPAGLVTEPEPSDGQSPDPARFEMSDMATTYVDLPVVGS
ncbi:ATP-binding protein [Actinoplanes sp. GCM10030250]|uniref:sensor histidine kinase n=1 Tax=Actinoplanes sp. GCM10030250 TaxID=3273376 RepID=UPI0036211B02